LKKLKPNWKLQLKRLYDNCYFCIILYKIFISKFIDINFYFQDNIIEGEIRIDPKHHRHFVARRGGVLHRIADECGGVQISFPRAGIDSDRVILKGSHECIEAAKQRMREIVQELVNRLLIQTNAITCIIYSFLFF